MNKLKELRKAKGISQTDLASMLSVKQNTISNWENGVTEIDQNSVVFLADFFNTSIDYILGRDTSKFEQKNQTTEFMSADEKKLLRIFKELSPAEQEVLLMTAETFYAAQSNKKEQASPTLLKKENA